MKYNQKKKKENVEIFLFIMVMAVFAAVGSFIDDIILPFARRRKE